MKHWRTIIAGVIAIGGFGLLGLPAFGANYPDYPIPTQPGNYPDPGTLNYVEGAVHFDGTLLTNRNLQNKELTAGQELTTGTGKAEILLTPGIYLRVGSNSTVKMISPDLAQTQVALLRGKAGVEVDWIQKQNMVQIVDNGVTTQLMKNGYYEFDANPPEAKVFSGRAEVSLGDGRWEKVKAHHELALAEGGPREKTVAFNDHPTNDGLYNWSRLRSEYLAEATNQQPGDYWYGYPGWGWGWDPWMWGMGWGPFYSPFGWGFYPWGGFYGGGLGFYGGGIYGGRFYHHGWYGRGPGGNHLYGHGFYGGGMHGGSHAFAGGGFHGGDGFHGGGMASGFHGGGGFGGGRR